MSKAPIIPDLIPYDEMYRILREKFNATHDELRFWIKISLEFVTSNKFTDSGEPLLVNMDESFNNGLYLLSPYGSDLPTFNECYDIPPDRFFYPKYYFYWKQAVLQFIPSPHLRFVYRKDLTGKRHWHSSTRSFNLLKANECGILRFYDQSLDEFTFFANDSQLWCHSFEVQKDYVENPETFFLLYDILKVERIFFGKDKELCLNELGIKSDDLPKNVINLKKYKE